VTRSTLLFLVLLLSLPQGKPAPDYEAYPYAPRSALVFRASPAPRIDGRLDDDGWQRASWSEPFVDIEGDRRPAPRLLTRVKMLWDDRALYIAADLEEPDLWGTITTRDAVIFHDNDFEVFVDPDGDTHNYYELEVNALGTPWDLFLPKPYRDGGPAIDAWDIAGLQVGVDLRGTINRPGDRDRGWSVELALPWSVLEEAAPGQRPPRAGDRWRINFSRVQWQLEVKDGAYAKRLDPATGRALAENNWVWSPQGAIDMHMPERWGVIEFADRAAGATAGGVAPDPDDAVKWALRRLYYRQRVHRAASGAYATTLAALKAADIVVSGKPFQPAMVASASSYEISAPGRDGVVRIRDDGRVWVSK
jgi:hypothetical protein